MRKYFLSIISLLLVLYGYGQALPDSVLHKYTTASSQREKSKILWHYLQNSSFWSKKLENYIALQKWFKKRNDETGVNFAQMALAAMITRKGDYTTSLSMSLKALASFEAGKDTIGIICALRRVSNSYEFAQNFEQAIAWNKKTLPYVIAIKDPVELSNSYNDIGATYAKANMPDSGLVYAQQAVNMDMRSNNELNLPFSLSTLAENYIANKNYDLALPFLRRSLSYANKLNSPWAIGFTEMDMAQAFLGLQNYDSAVRHAHDCLHFAGPNRLQELLLKSYTVIFQAYEKTNRHDSANKYFRLAAVTKDSLYTIEKLNYTQNINFREQLRQQEADAEIARAEEERKHNIQYIAMAIGILLFTSIFLLLTNSIIVNEKWLSFLGILGLLVVFEFINLLIHPFLEEITHHSPVLMLLSLVSIAALLIPLHHKLEHWIKHKMVEKNKKIRLEAAKKTIQELQNNTGD